MDEINQGLDYAQMLEIPVSTVNVVKKKSLFKRKQKNADDLKDMVVDSVNDRMGETDVYVRTEDLTEPVKAAKKGGAASKIIIAEAVAACLIAAGIFVSNIFLPDTVINTFMGNISSAPKREAAYNEFVLTPVVSDFSDAEISVTKEGVICFTQKAAVYPVCEGEIASVTKNDGLYTVKIAHTSKFTSVVTGLDVVYAGVGERVASNLPFAYSNGETQVRVSMYDGEQLLNCYTLSGAVPVWNS